MNRRTDRYVLFTTRTNTIIHLLNALAVVTFAPLDALGTREISSVDVQKAMTGRMRMYLR